MSASAAPLRFLFPGWFAIVMGLCGLSLAWLRAEPVLGAGALAAGLAIGATAAGVFALLAAASLWRALRYPQALAEDLAHPVRHPFIAAVPISVLLLATVAQALFGPQGWIAWVWGVGAAGQFAATVWVLARWLAPPPGGFAWPSITPVLFIPVVGNVLTPLAGVPLGLEAWAAAQFGVGLLFWPVALTLLVVRIGLHGLWPPRLLAATFITIAPPAVVGLALLRLGAPLAAAWACWGLGLFFLAWSLHVVRRLVGQPFGIPSWALSFPLAAFAALTLALGAQAGPAFALAGVAALALASLVIAGLLLGTWRGLRQGTLLVAEPAPAAAPAPAPAPAAAAAAHNS